MSAGPISLWLALQLGALALAAFRVPLAAGYPLPVEFQAVKVMLGAQLGGIALLFPWLLRSRATVLTVIAAAWVMLMIAAALAAWPLTAISPVGALLTLWILLLATCRKALRPRLWAIGSAAACAYIVGGPLLAYLQLEFAESTLAHPEIVFGPLFAALSTRHHLPPLAWAEPAGLELIATLLVLLGMKKPERAPLHSAATF